MNSRAEIMKLSRLCSNTHRMEDRGCGQKKAGRHQQILIWDFERKKASKFLKRDFFLQIIEVKDPRGP